MQVGMADPGATDLDQYLARTRRGYGDIDDFRGMSYSNESNGFHGGASRGVFGKWMPAMIGAHQVMRDKLYGDMANPNAVLRMRAR
jgi:hypothetical protein